MREVPHQRPVRELAALQCRTQVDAIDRTVGRRPGADCRGNGGQQVNAGNWFPRDRSGFGHARPSHNPRRPQASLVGVALAAAQGRVLGRATLTVEPAVVACEDNQRAIRQPGPVKGFEQPAHGIVDAVHHGRIDGVVLPLSIAQGLIPSTQILLGLNRCVHRVVRQVQQKRPVLVALDELDGFVCLAICQILSRLPRRERRDAHRQTGKLHERVEVRGRLAIVPSAVVLVEALVQRQVALSSQVPLPDEGAGVTDRLEQLSQGDLAVRQLQLVHGSEQFTIGATGAVVAESVPNVRPLATAELELGADPVSNAKPGRRPSGHQGGPRGRTDRTRGVAIGKPHARCSQAVDVRRAVEVRALAA